MPDRLTADDLRALIAVKFQADAYAILWELPDGTGMKASGRRADAVVMSLWPSRGLTLHGMEIKVSRSDWQRELKDPSKAEALCRYCDYWSIVASDKDIVRDGELPPTWGLMVPRGAGLHVVKAAPKLTPLPVDRPFIAAVCRAGTSKVVLQNAAALRKEYDRGYAAAKQQASQAANHEVEASREFIERVKQFQIASGINVGDRWNGGEKVGRIVKAVLAGEHNRDLLDLQRVRNIAAGIVEQIDASTKNESEVTDGR